MGFVKKYFKNSPLHDILIDEVRIVTTHDEAVFTLHDKVIWDRRLLLNGGRPHHYYSSDYSDITKVISAYRDLSLETIRRYLDCEIPLTDFVDNAMIYRARSGKTFIRRHNAPEYSKAFDFLFMIMLSADRRISRHRYLPLMLTTPHQEVRDIIAVRMKI